MKKILNYAIDWQGTTIYQEMNNMKQVFPTYATLVDDMLPFPIWNVTAVNCYNYNYTYNHNYDMNIYKHFNEPLTVFDACISIEDPTCPFLRCEHDNCFCITPYLKLYLSPMSPNTLMTSLKEIINHPAWPHAMITFQPYGTEHVIITSIVFDNRIELEQPWNHISDETLPNNHFIYYEDGFFWARRPKDQRYLLGKYISHIEPRLRTIRTLGGFLSSESNLYLNNELYLQNHPE